MKTLNSLAELVSGPDTGFFTTNQLQCESANRLAAREEI